MSGWAVMAAMFIAVALWLAAVPLVAKRARRREEIKAAKLRHPSGKDLNNGR